MGKDHVARAIHEASGRSGAYVAVNMATISRATAASELFGHVKGAFTGANHAHAGLFGNADGGTLFLDEIGELELDVQGMLLRALETGTIRPLGASEARPCSVRVLAATDADLDPMVMSGAFRPALLHRLGTLEIHVAPLRERREDIPRLAAAFFQEALLSLGQSEVLSRPDPKAGPWLSRSIMRRLYEHDWPGNVRQLQNVVRRISAASRDQPRARMDTSIEALLGPLPEAPSRPSTTTTDSLPAVLERHGWAFSAAAKELGVSRAAFYRLVAEHPEVRTGADLTRDELVSASDACREDLDAMSAALRVSRRAVLRRLKALGLR